MYMAVVFENATCAEKIYCVGKTIIRIDSTKTQDQRMRTARLILKVTKATQGNKDEYNALIISRDPAVTSGPRPFDVSKVSPNDGQWELFTGEEPKEWKYKGDNGINEAIEDIRTHLGEGANELLRMAGGRKSIKRRRNKKRKSIKRRASARRRSSRK